MPQIKDSRGGEKPAKTIEEKITEVADRMKRSSATELKFPNGDSYYLTDNALKRFAEGADLERMDWDMLGTFLIQKRVPAFNFYAHEDTPDQRLQPGQKLFQLCPAFNDMGDDYGQSWYIQVLEGSSTKARTFAVRKLYGNPHNDLEATRPLECDIWKLSVESHLETDLDMPNQQPFQDAILFDILLELAIDDFKPHTRTIDDGPAIMLEILQALEVVQQEVEAAASSSLKKRRLTIQEKLETKRVKI